MASTRPTYFGLVAEFDSTAALMAAAHRVREAGYTRTEAYSPFPVEGLSEALGFRGSQIPTVVLIGGIVGCLGGFFMQWYTAAVYYPLNIAGRPYNSWPMFIPITFECTVLIASLAAIFGVLALNGLPRPHHPLFNIERFALATRDRFFLLIEAADPKFDAAATAEFLRGLGPREVVEVPH